MKVVVSKAGKSVGRCNSAEARLERSAIDSLTKPKLSMAYRRAVATNVPVTYVSRGAVVRIENGHKSIVCKVDKPAKIVLK